MKLKKCLYNFIFLLLVCTMGTACGNLSKVNEKNVDTQKITNTIKEKNQQNKNDSNKKNNKTEEVKSHEQNAEVKEQNNDRNKKENDNESKNQQNEKDVSKINNKTEEVKNNEQKAVVEEKNNDRNKKENNNERKNQQNEKDTNKINNKTEEVKNNKQKIVVKKENNKKNIKENSNESKNQEKNQLKNEDNKKDTAYETERDESDSLKEKKFLIVNNKKIPLELSKQIELFKEFKGYLYFEENDSFYTAIFMGKQNTGGYAIDVSNFNNKNENTNIIVQEIQPKKESAVTQAVTYPYIVMKFKKKPDNLIIKNKKGEEYMKFNFDNSIKKNLRESNIEYEKLFSNELPQNLKHVIDIYKDFKGYYHTEIDNDDYLIVFAGSKSSSGYGIDIVSVREEDEKIKVVVSESVPKKDMSYLTVITYPFATIKFKSDIKDFIVVDSFGNEYNHAKSKGVER